VINHPGLSCWFSLGFETYPAQKFDHAFEIESDSREKDLNGKLQLTHIAAATQSVSLFGFPEFPFNFIVFLQILLILGCFDQGEPDLFVVILFSDAGVFQMNG